MYTSWIQKSSLILVARACENSFLGQLSLHFIDDAKITKLQSFIYVSKLKKYSFEPESNQRPKDVCYIFQLQSSALPTELSKEG